jgi:hypothetical protein
MVANAALIERLYTLKTAEAWRVSEMSATDRSSEAQRDPATDAQRVPAKEEQRAETQRSNSCQEPPNLEEAYHVAVVNLLVVHCISKLVQISDDLRTCRGLFHLQKKLLCQART